MGIFFCARACPGASRTASRRSSDGRMRMKVAGMFFISRPFKTGNSLQRLSATFSADVGSRLCEHLGGLCSGCLPVCDVLQGFADAASWSGDHACPPSQQQHGVGASANPVAAITVDTQLDGSCPTPICRLVPPMAESGSFPQCSNRIDWVSWSSRDDLRLRCCSELEESGWSVGGSCSPGVALRCFAA